MPLSLLPPHSIGWWWRLMGSKLSVNKKQAHVKTINTFRVNFNYSTQASGVSSIPLPFFHVYDNQTYFSTLDNSANANRNLFRLLLSSNRPYPPITAQGMTTAFKWRNRFATLFHSYYSMERPLITRSYVCRCHRLRASSATTGC